MAGSVVRGSTVFFNAVFVDPAGAPATPSSANLYLVFSNVEGVRQKIMVPMTLAGNVASATWDSSVASRCEVFYSIKGVGSNAIVQDGNLTLTANDANTPS